MTTPRNVKLRWTALVAVILALILVPFACFGDVIEAWTNRFLQTAADHLVATALVLGGLLASDILLPVPSSIVSTACGFFLGVGWGAFTSWVGMGISCVLGFGLAAGLGRRPLMRLVGNEELRRLEAMYTHHGDWIIVLTRPVPVLAEAAVFFAGLGHMRFGRFALLCALSNAGVSLAYALIGALSSSLNTFLAAFAGAILLPGLFMILAGRQRTVSPR